MKGLGRQFVFHADKGRIQLEVLKIEGHLKVFPAFELISGAHRNKATGEVSVGVIHRDTKVDGVRRREAAGDCETGVGQQYDWRIVIFQDNERGHVDGWSFGYLKRNCFAVRALLVRCRQPLPGVDGFGGSGFGSFARRFGAIAYARIWLFFVFRS